MKRLTIACALAPLFALSATAQKSDTLTLFNDVTFYDGYKTEVVDKDVNDGICRFTNYFYSVKLTPQQLAMMGDSLDMIVKIRACCDNYDRLGSINLALVPKGQERYETDKVDRIEVGRFITPFMNKNKKPEVVPYVYQADYLSNIFRDPSLLKKYDYWMEFHLFGVPYAAQKEVPDCEGRIDTFYGTLQFATSKPSKKNAGGNVLVPIVIKKTGSYGSNLNNYDTAATDTLGKTVKSYTFKVPRNVKDAQIVLITSNHGANQGGEEYNRRWHYVYLDNKLITSYIPGRPTCEPYRKYNTQGNDIYGRSRRPNYMWQSFSNWCPGDAIDNRILSLGSMKAGTYTLTVSVPDAQFANKQGDIPVSAFFQGLTKGKFAVPEVKEYEPKLQTSIQFDGKNLKLESQKPIDYMELRDEQGKGMFFSLKPMLIDLSNFPTGTYLFNIYLYDGTVDTHKIEKK